MTIMPGKRVQFDQETWNVLDLLAMRDFQLADEALADLLRKHGRPVDLKTALRQSVGEIEKRPPAPSQFTTPSVLASKAWKSAAVALARSRATCVTCPRAASGGWRLAPTTS